MSRSSAIFKADRSAAGSAAGASATGVGAGLAGLQPAALVGVVVSLGLAPDSEVAITIGENIADFLISMSLSVGGVANVHCLFDFLSTFADACTTGDEFVIPPGVATRQRFVLRKASTNLR